MTTFLNGLWLGMVLSAVVWAVMKVTPGINAATRHVIWWMTLAVVLAFPFLGFVTNASAPAHTSADVTAAHETVSQVARVIGIEAPQTGATPSTKSGGEINPIRTQWKPIEVTAEKICWAVGAIWVFLSAGLAIRLIRSSRWIRRIRAGSLDAQSHLQAQLRELQSHARVIRLTA